MEVHSLLVAVTILLGAITISTSLSRWLGLGSIIALLAVGLVLGPSGLQIAPNVERLRSFTELGVVLLMFTIGIEMEPRTLWAMRRLVFGLGVLQVLGTGALLAGFILLRGGGVAGSVLGGLGLALSSTATGVQLLEERGERHTPYGRASFAVLLLQDLAIVPLLAAVPLIGGADTAGDTSLVLRLARLAAVVGGLVAAGRWLLPTALRQLYRGANWDGFTALVLLVILGSALAADWAGASMALGAFLTGMMLSGSELQGPIERIVHPLKQALLDLFFIAVGMSLDLDILVERGALMAATVVSIVAIKALALYTLGRWFQLGHTGAVRMAALLSQSGEFGFVLFGAAVTAGILTRDVFSLTVLVIALSMSLTPVLLKASDALTRRRLDAEGDPHEVGDGTRRY